MDVWASASAPGAGRELRQRRRHDVMGGAVAAAGAQAQARDGENYDHVRSHVKRVEAFSYASGAMRRPHVGHR